MKNLLFALLTIPFFLIACSDSGGGNNITNCGGTMLTDKLWESQTPGVTDVQYDSNGDFTASLNGATLGSGTWTCQNNNVIQIMVSGTTSDVTILSITDTTLSVESPNPQGGGTIVANFTSN